MQSNSVLGIAVIGALIVGSAPAEAKQCRSPTGDYLWSANLFGAEIPGSGGGDDPSVMTFSQKRAYFGTLYRKTPEDACKKYATLSVPSSIFTAAQRSINHARPLDATTWKCAFDCYSKDPTKQPGDGVVTPEDESQCGTVISAVTNLETEPMCDLVPNGPYKDLAPANEMAAAGATFGKTLRSEVIAKNRSMNTPGYIISDFATQDPHDLLNRTRYTDLVDDDAWADELGQPNPVGTYASSAQVDHIIPRVDYHGCACGPNSYANALLISAELNGAMSNNSTHAVRQAILSTFTKPAAFRLVDPEDEEIPEDAEMGGCSVGGGPSGAVALALACCTVAMRRRRR